MGRPGRSVIHLAPALGLHAGKHPAHALVGDITTASRVDLGLALVLVEFKLFLAGAWLFPMPRGDKCARAQADEQDQGEGQFSSHAPNFTLTWDVRFARHGACRYFVTEKTTEKHGLGLSWSWSVAKARQLVLIFPVLLKRSQKKQGVV